jgi:hypothetical protein
MEEKEALISMLFALDSRTKFLFEIAADVSALKAFAYSLAPNAKEVLDQHVATAHYKLREVREAYLRMNEALRNDISGTPN